MTLANAKPDLLITGPLGTNMVNAASSAWHDSFTVEAKITAAIAYAVSVGATAVYVPACFLPYTASLVTFNTGVRMVREGGNPEFYDLQAYGASNLGSIDCTASIVAALAAAGAGGANDTVRVTAGFYAHTAVTWNKRVNLIGDSSGSCTFTYTPTTGTAWTINPANNVSDPATFTFRGLEFYGGPSGYLNATTGMSVACDYFNTENCSTQQFGTGLTFGNNAFFLNFFNHNWQVCNQIMVYPNGLSPIVENIRFVGCTFVNAMTFANGVQIDGNAEFFFVACSFDNCQLNLSRAGAQAYCSGTHFETVNPLNPAAPVVKQTAGILQLNGGQVLIGSSAVAIPQFLTTTDTGDAGNTKCYVSGMHAFTGAGTSAFLTMGGGVHVWAFFDIQGNWANDSSGSTTGSMVLSVNNNRMFKTNGGFSGQLSTQADTTLVSGVDASLSGIGCTSNITAARLIGALVSPTKGQRFTYTLVQSGAGGFAITWNAVYKVSWSDTGNTTGKRSSISFIYDGTNWNQDGAQTPYV